MPIKTNLLESLKTAFLMRSVKGNSYLKKRGEGLVETWDYDDLESKAHSKSFTVAKTLGADVLQDIYDAVQKAKSEGTSLKDFVANLKPTLEAKGWWGKKEVDGKIVTLGTPHRLATILDTNVKTSFAQGRWESMMNIAEYRPWFVYEQIKRPTERHDHSKFHKHIYHYTNPIVRDIFPPKGFGCDCSMRAVNEKEKDRLVAAGYVLVDMGKEDEKFITEDMKSFDPLGDYKPKNKNYEPEIKKNLEKAMQEFKKKQGAIEQARLLNQIKQVATELVNIKNLIEKVAKSNASKAEKQKGLTVLLQGLSLIGSKISKLEQSTNKTYSTQIQSLRNIYTSLTMLTSK